MPQITQAVPENYSTPKENSLYVLRKSNSLEKVAVPRVTLAGANVYNCSSKKFTILNE